MCRCVYVCVCVRVSMCMQCSHTSFFDWVLVLVLGYILQFEEIAHKRGHYYHYITPVETLHVIVM